MNRDTAHEIFKCWQRYMETADRFHKLMMTPPPSFLPYPVDMMEEALNIVAKEYWNSGDIKAAKEIQRVMVLHLSGYGELHPDEADEAALRKMRSTLDLILENPSLKQTVLDNLKASQESWMEQRRSEQTGR